jgi:hypothetical protein
MVVRSLLSRARFILANPNASMTQVNYPINSTEKLVFLRLQSAVGTLAVMDTS